MTARPSRLLWCAVDPSGRLDWRSIDLDAFGARGNAALLLSMPWRDLRAAGWRVERVRVVPAPPRAGRDP